MVVQAGQARIVMSINTSLNFFTNNIDRGSFNFNGGFKINHNPGIKINTSDGR